MRSALQFYDKGWLLFEAIEAQCRTPTAYSGLKDVGRPSAGLTDSMQSFFFAETLKYLWLLFSDADVLPLDRYVFTTEGHPLRKFGA